MLSMRERRSAPDPEASAVSLRRDHAAVARRYGRLARVAYRAALASLASAVVLWALGVTTAEPLFRVLIVATLVFAVTGALVAKLAESAATRAAKVVIRRTSQPRREDADRES